jgi:hypothetical protein
MPTHKGIILNDSEILNNNGVVERYKTELSPKTLCWLHYSTSGVLTTVEVRTQRPLIKKKLLGSGE